MPVETPTRSRWVHASPGRAAAAGVLVLVAVAAGCSSERPPSVPDTAKSVALMGGGEAVRFTAPERGVAYVYERPTRSMVYSGWLKGGEVLELDPGRDEVRIGGTPVAQRQMGDLQGFEVWFDPRRP